MCQSCSFWSCPSATHCCPPCLRARGHPPQSLSSGYAGRGRGLWLHSLQPPGDLCDQAPQLPGSSVYKGGQGATGHQLEPLHRACMKGRAVSRALGTKEIHFSASCPVLRRVPTLYCLVPGKILYPPDKEFRKGQLPFGESIFLGWQSWVGCQCLSPLRSVGQESSVRPRPAHPTKLQVLQQLMLPLEGYRFPPQLSGIVLESSPYRGMRVH